MKYAVETIPGDQGTVVKVSVAGALPMPLMVIQKGGVLEVMEGENSLTIIAWDEDGVGRKVFHESL